MRESRGPFRFFVWYTVILRSAGPAVLTLLLVYGVMHSLFLPYFRSNIRESRKMVALELSRVAWGLIDGYYQRQLSGELSEEEAKSKAKERLRLLRYGPEGKDYFWITDYSPKIIMHPYRKDLEGKDPSEYAVEDRKLFREFAEKSKTTGFIEYRWQWKDNRGKIAPKLSSIIAFRPWGWIVGTGVYVDDVEREIAGLSRWINIVTTGLLALIALLSLYIVWNYREGELARMKVESELQKSEEKYRLLIENMNEGLIVVNTDRVVEYVNRRLCELSRYSFDELVGTDLMKLFDGENQQIIEEQLEKRRKGDCEPYEVRWKTKGGESVTTIVSPAPLYGEKGEYKGSFSVVTDISERIRNEEERRELQSQLIQTQKLDSLGRLAGGIAHDFNNILTVIMGQAQLALKRGTGKDSESLERIRGDVRTIHEAGERAVGLIRQLLVFSRKQESRSEVLNVNEVVANILKMLRHIIGEDIALETRLSVPLTSVKVDPARLEQVLINLIVNARDALAEQGQGREKRITIRTREEFVEEGNLLLKGSGSPGEYVILSVSDTGVGMSEEVKERLFEPFFTTKERGKGTGLGLSIVYAVVRQYNGIIKVDSVYGYGSTFEIYLPACTEAPKPIVKSGGEEGKGGGEVIVLVEDDEGVRNFALEVLTEKGYRVYAASGGEEALGVIRAEGVKPNLLFTDLVMPGMNGLTLAKKVATLFPEIRVLIASGYSEYDKEEIGEAKLPEGRVHFVSKPYTLQEIVQRVRAALASP